MANESHWNRRDFLTILNEILKIADGGASKTRIMYETNLSHNQGDKYLPFLQDRKLLQQAEAMGHAHFIYETTRKGMQYIQCYEEIMRLLK